MGTPNTAEPSEETSSTQQVAPGRLTADQERAMYLGIARTRRDMLAGREDALAKVEVERHLVLMAGRGFDRAVSEARAEGFAWEHIAEHVPGFKTAYGAEAAEKLFESMSVFGSSFAGRYVSWRCGDCDGLVLDRGPYGGHPADAEPGHQEGCVRLARDGAAYVVGLDGPEVNNESAVTVARSATKQVPGLPPSCRSIESQSPGLEL